MAKKKGPDKALINKAFRIKPVFSDDAGNLHYIPPVDVYDNLWTEHQNIGSANGLKELDTISIQIPLALQALPKPKIVHVLSKIPKEIEQDAVAFELRLRDQTLTGEDSSITASVTFYGGKLSDAVRDQPVIAMGKTYAKPFVRKRGAAKPAEVFNPAAAAVLARPVTAPKTAHFTRPPPAV